MTTRWPNPCSDGERLDFGHLGGTGTGGDPDSWYPELWDWLADCFGVRSVLDVGCGVGHAMKWFYEEKMSVLAVDGIDCAQVLEHHLLKDRSGPWMTTRLYCHDLTAGPLLVQRADLVWCCEVAEHLEERFADNVVRTVAGNCRKVLAFCAAPRGAGGHHHVNCQDWPYWAEKLTAAGLKYEPALTGMAREELCTPENGRSARNYFRRSGLIFTKD